MYYQTLKEMIDGIPKKEMIDGVKLKERFIDEMGGGSVNNMNLALKKLRKNKKINFVKKGVKIFYWKK